MSLRILLILAFSLQQFALPSVIAHGSMQCPAAKQSQSPNPGGTCCALNLASSSDQAGPSCTCAPNLCACHGDHQDEPAVPTQNNRSVDQLLVLLGLPTNHVLQTPQRHGTAAFHLSPSPIWLTDQHRLRAILCIWLT
jgi:hypothetical protein